MGLLGLTGPPDGGQCGVGVWHHQQPRGHRRRTKMAEQSPDKPAARGQGEDLGETEGRGQGDGRRSQGRIWARRGAGGRWPGRREEEQGPCT